MARLARLEGGLALLILVLISPNLATKEDACRPSCRGGYSRRGDFKYQEGTTYKYSFQSAIQISLSETSRGQQSTTGVKGTVLLSPVSPCSHSLKLENVEVVGSHSQRFSHIDGISMPIQFHFHEGVIGDHICADPNDRHNSLNIKRAIASLFMVDTENAYETDVFGLCPTVGVVTSEGGDVVITKNRDLDECDFRESIKEDFMVSSFDSDSDFKTSPMLTGEYSSQQRIKNGILDKAYVFENYTYLAFTDEEDKDELGAHAKVVTKLEYVGTSREYSQPIRGGEPKSIIFDNPHPITAERINMDSIITAIGKLKREDDLVVSEHAARDFLDLVKILRASNKDDMLIAFRQVKAGAGFRDRVGARKVFLDALFRCGTGNAIVAGVELLKNRELSPFEEKLVYLSFSFVKHATLSSLEAASSLLETPQLPREAYLGIGNLAGRYCREHQCNVDAVNRLTQRLSAKLRYGRVYTRDEENEIIFVLKALANIQHLDEGVVAKVTGIAQDKGSPTRLRVAALETYLSDACHESVRNGALHVLKDIQEDAELRIKAYLVLAKCPNTRFAEALKRLLEEEPSYQVGGFIVSHLFNLAFSANPDRQAAKYLLGAIGTNTKRKFPSDPRKFSFNSEFSYDLSELGVSSSVEANVIYSQNSFLPRSTNLNLTAELFGHSINFLEIGTRQQNLDRLLEHYFGPMGVFNQATPEEVKQSSLHSFRHIIDHFNRRLERVSSRHRGKRDVSKPDIENFGRQVQIRTNELNNELDLDLSIKLFGSELFFLSISDDTENLSPEDIIDRMFDDYERDMAQTRNFNHNYQTNTLFLDTEFAYPTSMGFPLRLGIEGTSSVQVKAKGDIDLAAMLDETPNGGVFKLSLIPSASVEVAASITLDAQVFESGLKVVSNLYTATGGDLEVNMRDRNRGLEAKFSLPLQKQKIISATHEVVLNTREIGKPEVLTPITFTQNKDFNLCVNDLSPFFGLNLCMDMNSPPENSEDGPLLAGNYKFALSVDNEDFSLFHYKEQYYDDPYRKLGGEMAAEIIGKRQNQKLALKVEAFYHPELYFKASFVSPITTGAAEARLTNTHNEMSVSCSLQQDNQRYSAKAGLAIANIPSGTRFTPILEYQVPGAYGQQRLPINMQGSFVIEARQHDYAKLIFEDLKLHIDDMGSNNRASRGITYSINGNVRQEGHDYTSDLTLSEGYTNIQLLGKVHLQRNLMNLDGQVRNSRDPQSNVHVIYEFKRHPTEIDSNFQLIHGSDPNSQRNKLTIRDSLIYKRINDYDYEVTTTNKVSYPLVNFDAQFDYTATPKSIFYDAEVKYERFLMGSEMNVKYDQRAEGDYDLTFRLYDFDDDVELKSKLDVQGGDLYRTDNALVVNGAKYELSGTLTYRDYYDEFDSNADLLLRIPQSREPLQIHEEWRIKSDQVHCVLKINDHRQQYVDISLTESKENSNGNIKINIPHEFVLSAHGREARGTGNAEVTIDYISAGVSVKADTTFTITDPTYNFRLTVYPDFNRNRGQYISVTSNNQVKDDSIVSKNTIDSSGSKTQLNYILTDEDKESSGRLVAEFDLTMPDGDFGAVKYNYGYNEHNDKLNSEQAISVEARGLYDWRNARISLKEILKDVDVLEDTYDYTYIFDSDDGEGRRAHAEVGEKRADAGGGKISEEAKIKIHGNRDSDGLDAKASAVYDDFSGTYDIFMTYGGGYYVFDVDGKYDVSGLFEDDEPIMEEINIEVKTPNVGLQHMKINAAVSIENADDFFSEEGEYLKIKGSGAFSLNENQRSHCGNSLGVNLKGDADLKIGLTDGTLKLIVSTRKDPITITANYDYEETDTSLKFKGSAGVQYERYKNLRSDITVDIPNEHEIKIDYGLESPQAAPIRVQLVAKESENGEVYKGEAIITTNNGRFVLVEELDLRDTSPGFNVQLTYPNGQVDQVLARFKFIRTVIEGEAKVKLHEHNFVLESRLDIKYESEDDFSAKFTANCPMLEIYNFVVDIQNSGTHSSPQNLLANRFGDSSDPRSYGTGYYEDPRYTTEDPRYTTEDPRYTTEDPRYTTEDPYKRDPYYNRDPYSQDRYNQDPYRNQDPRYTSQNHGDDNRDSRYQHSSYDNRDLRYDTQHSSQDRYNQDPYRNQDPRYTNQNHGDDNRDSRYQHSSYDNRDTRYDTQDPRYDNQDSRYDTQHSSYDNRDSRYDTQDPRYDTRDPRYGNHDTRYDTYNSQQTRDDQSYRYKRNVDQRYGDSTYGQSGYGDSRRRDPNYQDSSHRARSHGERLQVTVQHAGRNLLSGSASYQITEQGDTVTIEGGGSLRIQEGHPKQHHYKIVQRVYSSRDGGTGMEYTWNLDANSEVLDGKLKMTDTEFSFLTTYCEQRSQCARVQVDSKMFLFGSDNFDIEQTVLIDFRSIGWQEVGISESIKYQGNVFDAAGHLSLDNRNKYQYRLFGDDKRFEASVTTPVRVVSLEGKVQAPYYGYGRGGGPSTIEIDFYLDKLRQPRQKSALKGLVDCRGGDDIGKCNIELKFTDPSLRKDLIVVYNSNYNYPQGNAEYNVIFDIFNNPNNKVVCTGKIATQKLRGGGASIGALYEVKSQGLNIDIKYEESLVYDPQYAGEVKYNNLARYHVGRVTYDNLVALKFNPQHVLLHVKVLNKELLHVDSKLSSRNYYLGSAVTNIRAMGVPPTTVNVELSETKLKLSVSRMDNPSERLELNANVLGGAILDLDLKYYERGRPYNLITTYMRINSRDELDTLYEYDRQNINRLIIQPSKAEYNNMKRQLSQLKENAERNINSQMQWIDEYAKWDMIDLTPMEGYYQSELEKITGELDNDPALNKLYDYAMEVLDPVFGWIMEVSMRMDEMNEKSKQSVERQYQELMQKIDREIKPWLRENGDKLIGAAEDTFEAVENLIAGVVDEVVRFVDEHEREIRQFATVVVDGLEDVIIFAVKLEREIEKEITEELDKLYKEFKSMAVFEELDAKLKQALEGRYVPESYIRNFREAVNNVKDSTDSPALKKFFTVLGDYTEQKLRRQPVDDATALTNILDAAFDVLVEIYNALDSDDDDGTTLSWEEAVYAIPKLTAAELSPITQLFAGEWPDFEEMLESVSLEIEDWNIPEDIDAYVAQGQHIFTFDGKHLLFPGSCDYLFARDAINGNFSIVGSYRNGELTSITFADKHDAVTIRKGGQVLLNQGPVEYPVRRQHRLEVHRSYESIKIWSKTGVEIVCGPELLVCGFHISGYYHAQLRGLLGNANNEPYDDFTLRDGMIVSREAEFVNSYKVGGHCADVRTPDYRGRQRNPTCSRLFGSDSPMSWGFYFVDPDIFRTACERGTAAGVRDTEHAVAVAYVAACAAKGITVEVPPNYVTCHNHDKPVRVDEEFSVTTPGRSADIILVVDQDKLNEHAFRELIQPLTLEVTNTLSREGISDVDFHLIGYGGEYEKHPAHYTVDGKLTFKGGRTPNLHFSNPPKESARETFMEYVERVSDEVELVTGQDMVSEAYSEALDYPFRANSVKSIIVLNAKPCEDAELEAVKFISSWFALDQQLTVNLFTPFKGIDPRNPTTSNIIGFDEHTIYTFSNPTGSKQRNAIEHSNFCIEFALKSRGNVFVVNNFVQGRSKQQFIQVAAQTIAKELTNSEQFLDCKCEMSTSYTAKNVCKVQYTRPRQTAAPQRRRQHG